MNIQDIFPLSNHVTVFNDDKKDWVTGQVVGHNPGNIVLVQFDDDIVEMEGVQYFEGGPFRLEFCHETV